MGVLQPGLQRQVQISNDLGGFLSENGLGFCSDIGRIYDVLAQAEIPFLCALNDLLLKVLSYFLYIGELSAHLLHRLNEVGATKCGPRFCTPVSNALGVQILESMRFLQKQWKMCFVENKIWALVGCSGHFLEGSY